MGDIITPPEVGKNANGDIFLSWDKSIPTTMPDENLEFTAVYGGHVHNYTSEVTTPATPLELVSVDPADGAELESVSKFTFTFNKPVTIGEEGGVTLSANGGTTTLEVIASDEETSVVTFTTGKEITVSGDYELKVAAGTFVDADGNTNEEMMLNYVIEAAINSFELAYSIPAVHQVQKSLKVLTIGFIGEVQDVVSSKSINVVDAEGKTVTTAKLGLDDYDWNAVIVTFKDEITAPGQYSITIPEIIRNAVHTFAGEPYHNIIINDLDKLGVEMQRYIGSGSIYLKQGLDDNYQPLTGRNAFNLLESITIDTFDSICEDWVGENSVFIKRGDKNFP